MSKILVVDDDLFFMQMLRDVLEKHGHQVHSAPDGEIALKMFYDGDYEVIICDLIMPNMDGMELIMELRKNYPDVKIIAVSGGDKQLHASTYLTVTKDLGANYVFEKPLSNSDILSAIEEPV